MARNIATQLALGRVVVLHVDADVPWVDTDPAPHQKSKHLDKLRRALDHARGTRGVAPDDLVIMAPHAAIEAWTFRNTHRALRFVREADPDAVERTHAVWSADPTLLDQVPASGLRKQSPLRSARNLELLRAWPTADALAEGRSFARFVRDLRASPKVSACSAGSNQV